LTGPTGQGEEEASRKTLAELLAARAHSQAAAIVGLSEYSKEYADNWGGGQVSGGYRKV